MRSLTAICFLAIGFTHFSQLHPNSKIALPTVTSPLKFARSIFPFSKVRVSSGEESKLFSEFCSCCHLLNVMIV